MYLSSTIPFVYLIGWSALNRFYIGSIFAKGCSPKDLMVTYQTSSKYVKKFIEEHGLPDIIEIHKTFNSKKATVQYEHKLLRRINAAEDPRFLNRWNSGTFINISHTFSIEHRMKMSEAKKGKQQTPEHKQKISEGQKERYKVRPCMGKPHTEETKQKIREARLQMGSTLSLEGKQRIIEAQKGKTVSIETRKRMSETAKSRRVPNNHNAVMVLSPENGRTK